jgi:hypothetical protein
MTGKLNEGNKCMLSIDVICIPNHAGDFSKNTHFHLRSFGAVPLGMKAYNGWSIANINGAYTMARLRLSGWSESKA